MNSASRQVHRFSESLFDLHSPHSHSSALLDQIRNPAVLVPLLVIAFTVVYQVLLQSGRILALFHLVPDIIVFLIPARLLFALDDALEPVPLFLRRDPDEDPALAQSSSSTSFFTMASRHSRAHHAAKRKAARRVLGRTRAAGIMKFVAEAGKPSLGIFGMGTTAANGKDSQDDVPPGLANPTNYCFQNSVLQALASLDVLPEYLRSLPVLEESEEQQTSRCCGAWSSPSSDKGCTGETLRKLLAQLNDPANRGRTLRTPGVLKNMSTWQQQDAQEYFSKLLDQIDDEAATAAKKLGIVKSPHFGFLSQQKEHDLFPPMRGDDAASSHHSDDSGYRSLSPTPDMQRGGGAGHTKALPRLPHNPVEGLLTQRVVCTTCGFTEGLSLEPFNCVTVDLGQMDGHHINIVDRLDSYTSLETVEGVHCPKCTLIKFRKVIMALAKSSRGKGHEKAVTMAMQRLNAIEDALENDDFTDETLAEKCNVPPKQRVDSTKTKQIVVARPPQSLVVHVNRSVFDEQTGYLRKNAAAVRFPKTLDLGPWCLGSADLPGVGEKDQDEKEQDEKDQDEAMSIPGGLPHHNTKHQHHEHWVLHPEVSMVAGTRGHSKITGPVYELRAVVTHFGRHDNGHYVCYRRMRRPAKREQREKAEMGGAAGKDENEDRGDVSTRPSSAPTPAASDAGEPAADALGVREAQDDQAKDEPMTEAEPEAGDAADAVEGQIDRGEMDEEEVEKEDLDEQAGKTQDDKKDNNEGSTKQSLADEEDDTMDQHKQSTSQDLADEDLADDEMADANANEDDPSLNGLSQDPPPSEPSSPSGAWSQSSPREGSAHDGSAHGGSAHNGSAHDRTSGMDSPSNDEMAVDSPAYSDGVTIMESSSSEPASPCSEGGLESAAEEEEEESEWWRMSDEDVAPVSLQHVLAQGGVFMLFYDCIDPSSVLTGGEDHHHADVMDEKMAAAAAMDGEGEAGDNTVTATGEEEQDQQKQAAGVPSETTTITSTSPPATPATPESPDSALFPPDGAESTLVAEEGEIVLTPASRLSFPASPNVRNQETEAA